MTGQKRAKYGNNKNIVTRQDNCLGCFCFDESYRKNICNVFLPAQLLHVLLIRKTDR